MTEAFKIKPCKTPKPQNEPEVAQELLGMFKVNKNSKLNGCRLGLPKNYANFQSSYIVISTAKKQVPNK